jgi:hypothetical protein
LRTRQYMEPTLAYGRLRNKRTLGPRVNPNQVMHRPELKKPGAWTGSSQDWRSSIISASAAAPHPGRRLGRTIHILRYSGYGVEKGRPEGSAGQPHVRQASDSPVLTDEQAHPRKSTPDQASLPQGTRYDDTASPTHHRTIKNNYAERRPPPGSRRVARSARDARHRWSTFFRSPDPTRQPQLHEPLASTSPGGKPIFIEPTGRLGATSRGRPDMVRGSGGRHPVSTTVARTSNVETDSVRR